MRVLIATASRRGATSAIGGTISQVLADRGFDVVQTAVGSRVELASYDAAVVGSGVYNRHWLPAAEEFVYANATTLHAKPVWLFSNGPTRTTSYLEGRPLGWRSLAAAAGARGHQVFGTVDRPTLAVADDRAGGVAREFADWEAVRVWARSIAAELGRPASRSA